MGLDISNLNLFGVEYEFCKDKLAGIDESLTELEADIIDIQNINPSNLLVGVTWEQGTIQAADGSNGPSSTRIRTVGFIDLQATNTLSFTIATGYKFVIDWYNSDKTKNGTAPFGVWQTSNLTINVPEGVAYMRLLVASTSDGTASTDFAQYLTVEGTNNFIDAVNKINGMEDSIVDTYIDPLNERIKNLTDYNPPYKYMDIDLEMGGYNADGTEQTDTSGIRWRTPNYIYVSDMTDTNITVPTGFNMYVCLYGEGNTFKSRSTWGSGATHNVAGNYSIRWTIVKATWVAMTEEEANCVLIKEKLPWYEYLANSANPLSVYPSYYDTQIKSVASSFISDMMSVGENGDGFAFLTDVHWNGNYKHSPSLLYYLKENTNLDLILCGGDLIDRSTSDKASQITDMQNCIKTFKEIGIPFVTAIGNHERNSAGVTDSTLYLSENEVFSITQNPVNWMQLYYSDLERICFYLDRSATKTRYIFIDSGQNNIADYDITADEITWLTTVINTVNQGWHIVIIVHQLGDYQYLNNPVDENNPFIYTEGAQDMLDVLDDLSENHNIEAIFAGHTHVDNNATTTGGIPIIWTNSDARWQYHGMTQPSDGTVDAQCFDVVTMDYVNKKIYLRRVGRGSDRTISY